MAAGVTQTPSIYDLRFPGSPTEKVSASRFAAHCLAGNRPAKTPDSGPRPNPAAMRGARWARRGGGVWGQAPTNAQTELGVSRTPPIRVTRMVKARFGARDPQSES